MRRDEGRMRVHLDTRFGYKNPWRMDEPTNKPADSAPSGEATPEPSPPSGGEPAPPAPRIGADGKPIYDQEFFLKLALRGKEVWNCWRAERYISVTFKGVDFREPANAVIDFSGFRFGDEANFSGATFGDGADFFGKGAKFSGATFRGSVRFNASEGKKAKSDMFGMNFEDVKFAGTADFSGRKAIRRLDFTRARFNQPPIFDGCEGKHLLDFYGARIGFAGSCPSSCQRRAGLHRATPHCGCARCASLLKTPRTTISNAIFISRSVRPSAASCLRTIAARDGKEDSACACSATYFGLLSCSFTRSSPITAAASSARSSASQFRCSSFNGPMGRC